MKSIELLELIGQTPDEYVLDAQDTTAAAAHIPNRIWLIAAVVAAMVFLLGCAWALFRMEDMKIGTSHWTIPAYDVQEDGFSLVGSEEISSEILSISGLRGSGNHRAVQEWMAFMMDYDPDHAIMNSVWGNYPEFPDEYDAFDPYSREMVAKVDEIAARYGLKLPGEKISFPPEKIHLLPEALGISGFLMENGDAQLELFAGNCYAGGNFQTGFTLDMPQSPEQWPYSIHGDITYCRDEYFSPDTISLNEDYEWEEWNYTTASGWNVLMLRSDSHFHGWIICKREEAMITVKVEVAREEVAEDNWETEKDISRMTNRQMELVADVIDFGIAPERPDVAWIKEKLED